MMNKYLSTLLFINVCCDVFAAGLPAKPVLIAPVATITAAKPIFQWQAVTGAQAYKLVLNDGAQTRWLNQVITSEQAQCAEQEALCRFMSPVALPVNSYLWSLKAKNVEGYGLAASKRFRRSAPDTPIPVAPIGDITSAMPQYQWQAVSGAESYQLIVNDDNIKVLDKLYSTTQAGCKQVGKPCNVNPDIALTKIAHTWQVRAKNKLGASPWSSAKKFNNLQSCLVTLVQDNTTGGCHVRLQEPAACEEIDLSNGKEYLLGWTTDGTYCETPWTLYLAGNPANLATGNNIYSQQFSTDVSVGITHYGGLVRISAKTLTNLGLTSDNGIYHWVVVSWYGSHPASQAFRVKQ